MRVDDRGRGQWATEDAQGNRGMAGLKKIALSLAAAALVSGGAQAAAAKKKGVRCVAEGASVACPAENKRASKSSRGASGYRRGEAVPAGNNNYGSPSAGGAGAHSFVDPKGPNVGQGAPSSAIYHGSPVVTGAPKPTSKIIVPRAPVVVVPSAKIKVH